MNYGKWAFGLALIAVIIALAGIVLVYTRLDPAQTQSTERASQGSTSPSSESVHPTTELVTQSPNIGSNAREAFRATTEANRQVVHDATFAAGEFLRTTSPFMTAEQRAEILGNATKVKTVYQQTIVMTPPTDMQQFHTKWTTALLSYSEAADEWMKFGNDERMDVAGMIFMLDTAWTAEQEAWELLTVRESGSSGTTAMTDRLFVTPELQAAYESGAAEAGAEVLKLAGIDPNSSVGRAYVDSVSRNAATWYQNLQRKIGRVPSTYDFYQLLRVSLLKTMFFGA